MPLTGRYDCPECGPETRFDTLGDKRRHMRASHPKAHAPKNPSKPNRHNRQGCDQ